MACENAINGTDILKGEVEQAYAGDDLADRALFANTAVDRIVPAQAPDAGLDVTVETYFEWAIEPPPFEATCPRSRVPLVDDLEPYIERKLFTVNTGHATAAYSATRRASRRSPTRSPTDAVRRRSPTPSTTPSR